MAKDLSVDIKVYCPSLHCSVKKKKKKKKKTGYLPHSFVDFNGPRARLERKNEAIAIPSNLDPRSLVKKDIFSLPYLVGQ